MILLLQLFLAHITGDFFLQSDKWIIDKERRTWRSPYLYVHIVVHFILILILVGSVAFWKIAAFISVTHFIIDLAKLVFQKDETKRIWFFVDQSLHLIVLILIWGYLNNAYPIISIFSNTKIMVLLTSILTLMYPASIMIRNVISKWRPDTSLVIQKNQTLPDAGQLIGFLERFLVFVFIMTGKWEGVGFLLAAKSVFRFGDLKEARDMKLTEYVLIGTLLSFGIAICIALWAKNYV